jgi:nicotinamidase-related amidase
MAGAELIAVDDSVLCVVDVQPWFVDRLPETTGAGFVARIAWLCRLAGALSVPVVVTEEESEENGSTAAEIVAALPAGTRVFPKPVFGLAAVPEILAEVEGHGRGTVVLAGMETDVCIAHSAIGLLERGHRVVVVRDAVASPGPDHEYGLERLRDAGAVLLGVKGLFYEWVRTVERSLALQELAELPAATALEL